MRPGSRRIFIYYRFIQLKAAYFMCRDSTLSGIISLCFRHYRSKFKSKSVPWSRISSPATVCWCLQ